MDLVYLAIAVILIVAVLVLFLIIFGKRFEKDFQMRLDESLNKASQDFSDKQGKSNSEINEKITEKIGNLQESLAERLGRIDEAQNNLSQLSNQVISLRKVLEGNQTRGRFGEMQLKLLLQNAFGNTEGLYSEQYSIGNVRPDAVIFLPEPEKLLCIDSKFPFAEYQELFKEGLTDEQRNALNVKFRAAVKTHITTIKNKYIIEGETCPYAVMFIPNDGIFYYVNVQMDELADYARSVNVILSSPGTLQPILATISLFWREQKRSENLKEISKQISDIATAFRVFHKSWDPFKNSLNDAYGKKETIEQELQKLEDKLNKISRAEIAE